MALRDIDDNGNCHDVLRLEHQSEFNQVWLSIPLAQRNAIEAEINQRLDELIASPSPNWGSITNTSIEGGRANPSTGVRGDWSGTVFDAIRGLRFSRKASGNVLRERVEKGHYRSPRTVDRNPLRSDVSSLWNHAGRQELFSRYKSLTVSKSLRRCT